jgi:hypothetical protein
MKGLAHRILDAGFKNLNHYLFDKNVSEERLTGLHFVDVGSYYISENRLILDKNRSRLFERFFFPEILTCNDEVLLAKIVKDMGYDIKKVGVQTDPVKSLDYCDIYRDEFRPHHGFHLGMLKTADFEHLTKSQLDMFAPILESATYKYYLSKYLLIIKRMILGYYIRIFHI